MHLEKSVATETPSKNDADRPLPTLGTITAEAVKELVRVKKQRVKTLATHFSVAEYEVEKIIDSASSGLKRGARGWIELS